MRVVVGVLLAAGLLAACGGKRASKTANAYDPASSVGVYRARIDSADGDTRRFRMRLFVTHPDRLHAEMSGAVGGPKLIVDAGRGRLALTVVDDAISYVGGTSRADVRRALGIDVSVAGFVEAFLDGVSPDGEIAFSRSPEAPGSLPERFEVAVEGGTLRIERKRVQALPAGGSDSLGAGVPPGGTEIRPLFEIGEGGLLGAAIDEEPT